MSTIETAADPATVRVWDPFVRIFHWSLVAAFAFAYLTGDDWDEPHEIAGYVVTALVAFRIVWGFIGPRHARFADFVTGPASTLGYLKDAVRLRAQRYLGHNPAGAAMIIALLALIAIICATGLVMEFGRFPPPGWVEELHEVSANAALLLVIAHIAGVALASYEHGENLVKAMVTGRKRAQ